MAKQTPTTVTSPASAAAALTVLPPGIETFKVGTTPDSEGVVRTFTEADIQGMVDSYDPALSEAPLTIGHPADDLPAYGWVQKLRRVGDSVVMDTHQVQPAFAEMVHAKLYKKRSSSFYPPAHPSNPKPGSWYLRHVAFLGAQPPAMKGMADFSAAHMEGLVYFSSGDEPAAVQAVAPATPPLTPVETQAATATPLLTQEQIQMSKELQDKLDAMTAKQADTEAALAAAKTAADTAAAQVAQFAEQAKKDRTAGFVSFAEGVKPEVLLPKDRPMVVAALEALADAKPVSFAEGGATKTVSPAEWLKTFVATRAPVVSFGEHAPGNAGAGQGTEGMTDAQIDAKAKTYARLNKVSYTEALSAVVTFSAVA